MQFDNLHRTTFTAASDFLHLHEIRERCPQVRQVTVDIFELVVALPCHVVTVAADQFIRIDRIRWILFIDVFLHVFHEDVEGHPRLTQSRFDLVDDVGGHHQISGGCDEDAAGAQQQFGIGPELDAGQFLEFQDPLGRLDAGDDHSVDFVAGEVLLTVGFDGFDAESVLLDGGQSFCRRRLDLLALIVRGQRGRLLLLFGDGKDSRNYADQIRQGMLVEP